MSMKIGRCAILAAVALGTANCAGQYDTTRAAVSYNRSFAESRNQVLLENILRASAREPLQFSLITQVNGGVRNTTSIKLPLTNLIAGGANAISPEISLGDRNPTITITPSITREFVQGMMRPITVRTIDDMIAQGWHRPSLLGLVIGGVQCRVGSKDPPVDEVVLLNQGDDTLYNGEFLRAARSSDNFNVDSSDDEVVGTLRMTGAEAAEMLSRGPGEGRRIASVTAIKEDDRLTDRVAVDVVTPGNPRIRGLSFAQACGRAVAEYDARSSQRAGASANSTAAASDTASPGNSGTGTATAAGSANSDAAKSAQTQLDMAGRGAIARSVQSMIYYLGQLHSQRFRTEVETCGQDTRPPSRSEPIFFRIRVACDNAIAPASAVVSTAFQGRTYYIPSAAEAGPYDHTLTVLSLLTELLALQTSDAATATPRPLIAITQ